MLEKLEHGAGVRLRHAEGVLGEVLKHLADTGEKINDVAHDEIEHAIETVKKVAGHIEGVASGSE